MQSMSGLEAFLLGLIQGVTEFLPISSSGHLALGQYMLGFNGAQDYILFDLVCHLGTLSAICLVFYPLIKKSLMEPTRFWPLVIGTLPLIPLVLILKPIKSLFDQPEFLGPCFLVSAGLLFASLSFRIPIRSGFGEGGWRDHLAIGTFQAAAILPGVSRSGATISAARLLGWHKEEAIQFSFLLAIPAILGGTLVELWEILKGSTPIESNSFWPFTLGFFTSFFVGTLSLLLLVRLVNQNKWIYFAWYCLFLGLATTLYFNL